MLNLNPDELAVLQYRTLADDPRSLAAALYGPTWIEAVRPTETGWRTSRDPLPAYVADFLADALVDAVAHDGRSTREARSSGWWIRDTSDRWRPASLNEIAQHLHQLVRGLLDEASDARRKSFETLSRSTDDAKERADQATRSDALRVAVLSGLSHLIASHGRNVSASFAALRDRLVLPEDAFAGIAQTWLDDAFDLGDLNPDTSGRLAVADVRDLYERQDRSGVPVLPLQTLYRALDTILGPRSRRISWTLPNLDAA